MDSKKKVSARVTKLKPCPFCGGKAELDGIISDEYMG